MNQPALEGVEPDAPECAPRRAGGGGGVCACGECASARMCQRTSPAAGPAARPARGRGGSGAGLRPAQAPRFIPPHPATPCPSALRRSTQTPPCPPAELRSIHTSFSCTAWNVLHSAQKRAASGGRSTGRSRWTPPQLLHCWGMPAAGRWGGGRVGRGVWGGGCGAVR